MGEFTRKSLRALWSRPLLVALIAAPTNAAGEPAPVPPPSTQDAQPPAPIIITGSRLPRVNLTAASPVTTITGDEIERSGTTNVEEALNALPQVAPTEGAFLNNGAKGIATVDLRNLGPARTLVLINGRRLGPGDPTEPVADLDLIPPTMIKRVELLTGGASSVYGSDAVSGVVNFILDTHLEGVRVDGQYSFFQHDNHTTRAMIDALDAADVAYPKGGSADGGRSRIDVAVGKAFVDGRAHVAAYAGYTRQETLTQDARDYSACTATVRPRHNDLLICGGAIGSAPSSFATNFDTFHTGPDRTFLPGQLLFNFGPYNYYQRPDDRYTAGAFGDFEINKALVPYFELMFLHDRSVAQLAPSVTVGHLHSINCDNPLLSKAQLALACFDGNYVGQEESYIDQNDNLVVVGTPTPFVDPVSKDTYYRALLDTQWRNVEGGPRQQDLRHRTLRFVSGLKGEVAKGVTYDASYVQSKADLNVDATRFLAVPRLRRALDVVADPATGKPVCRSVLTGDDPACVPLDIFTEGGVSQAAADYVEASANQHGWVKEQVANVNSTLELGEWGIRSPWSVETPSINGGAEYRKDRLVYVPDPLQFTGDLAGSGQAQLPTSGSTEVKELFAETRVPIVQKGLIYGLALEAGYRKSWYSNPDSKVSSNSWKLAAELAPIRDVRLRGSIERAVRAPNIIELFTPVVDGGLDNDRCAGPKPEGTLEECLLTGLTPAQYGHIAAIPQDSSQGYNALEGGNPELAPEVANTKTIGVVLQPRVLAGLTASIDWWSIKLSQAIGAAGAQTAFDTCLFTGDPMFCSRIHRDAMGSLWLSPDGYVDDRLINIAAFKVRGVDVEVSYNHRLGKVGSLAAEFVGTYNYKWTIEPGGLAETFDCAGLYGADCAIPTPKWRHKASATWTDRRGDVSITTTWRFTGSMSLAPIPDYTPGPYARKLDAQSYFDLSAEASINTRYLLRLGVNNIFDRDPPLVPSGGEGACEVGCNGNTYPQWYDPLGRYIFAGVTLNLNPF